MRIIDVDPSKKEFVVLSGSATELVLNTLSPHNKLSGLNHSPMYIEDGWLPNVPSLVFSGSLAYNDLAQQYLFDASQDVYGSVFSCTSGDWADYTVFVVAQFGNIPAVEMALLLLTQQQPSTWPGSAPGLNPKIFLYGNNTDFLFTIYDDTLGSSNLISLGSIDLNPHVFQLSADGLGNISGSIDGGVPNVSFDVRPKTVSALTLGAAHYPSFPLEQFNGSIARILMFDKNLSDIDAKKINNQLKSLYGI